MKGHYATETTKVFRSGNVWVCKTELRPYFENKTQVYDTKALRELGAASRNRSFTDCRDRIAIVDRTIKGKLTALVGCRENPAFGQFVDQVARNCGR
jgi:hypothetical protein